MNENDKNPLFGRKYKITVGLKGDKGLVLTSDSFEPEALRCTFHIEQVGYQAYYYGEITIYNLTGETEKQIIQEGDKVIVEAGYQNGNYGKIFEGYVFQPMRDRENVVDYKLTLNCINQKAILDHNLVKFTANAGQDPRTQINNIAKQARFPIELGKVTDNLEDVKLPRGKTYFGPPKKYFRDLADHSGAQWFVDDDKVHFSKISDPPAGQALVYTTKTGLIGTPQQIDYGVSFRVLLDPRLKVSNPAMAVKLDQAFIRQQKARLGQILSILDRDGVYRVIGVTHTGDTRGNDWYTDIIGVTSQGKVPAQLIGAGSAQSLDLPEFMQDRKENPN